MPSRAESGRLAPVRVVDVEVTSSVEPLAGLERYVGVQALLRRRGVPVGWTPLPVEGGRVPPDAIRRAIEACSRGESGPGPVETPPSVTVAVCTRDRPVELDRCLGSLEQLDLPGVDLLVVDNAPAGDATERLVRRSHSGVRYVREPIPGLDHARNRAIAEASGEILAFTDDDVVVDAGWARAIATAFAADAEVMAVTGLVVPWELDTDAQILFERYRSFGRGFAPMRVQADPAGGAIAWRLGDIGRLGTGANMAFRREVFGRVGPFDPALGSGTAARGGDDLEMLFRLLKAGYVVRYEPRAFVRHRHRREVRELQAQMWDSGVAFSASLVRSVRRYPEERGAAFRLWTWWATKLLYRAIRPSARPAATLRALAFAELKGVLQGLGRYRLEDEAHRPVPSIPYTRMTEAS